MKFLCFILSIILHFLLILYIKPETTIQLQFKDKSKIKLNYYLLNPPQKKKKIKINKNKTTPKIKKEVKKLKSRDNKKKSPIKKTKKVKAHKKKLKKQKKEMIKKVQKSHEISLKKPPQIIFQKIPNYPPLFQRKKIQGTVIVQVIISENHQVEKASIYKSCGYKILDKEALNAALQSKYKAQVNEKGLYEKSIHKVLFKFKI